MNTTMNTVNQIFDWGRFTSALQKEVVENKRQLLLVVSSIFLFFLLIMILGNVVSNAIITNDGTSESEGKVVMDIMPSVIVMSSYSFIVMIIASLAFRNLTSKAGRIALFTSPSSTTEKFIVNLVVYVIGAFAAFIVCAQLADLGRIAILSPFRSESFYVPGPLNFLSILTSSSSDIMSITDIFSARGYNASDFKLMTILTIFLGPAMYFMGSVLWPRWAVAKTFAVHQVINGVVTMTVSLIFAMPFLYSLTSDTITDLDDMDFSNLFSVSNFISYSIALVCWYGAWYLFKHKDVVSLKWWS